jgi:hypothetical protein
MLFLDSRNTPVFFRRLNSCGGHFQNAGSYVCNSFFNLASSKSVDNMLSVLVLPRRFEEMPRLGPVNENYRFEEQLQWSHRD